MVGKDITERLFLPRFCEMCCDCRMFHVRKVGISDWPFHKTVVDIEVGVLWLHAVIFLHLIGVCSKFWWDLHCCWRRNNRRIAGMDALFALEEVLKWLYGFTQSYLSGVRRVQQWEMKSLQQYLFHSEFSFAHSVPVWISQKACWKVDWLLLSCP